MLKLSYQPTRIRPMETKVKLEVGKRYKLKHKDGTQKGSSPDWYPFGGGAVPVFVLAEYPRFYLVSVLPHYNPVSCFGKSKIYNVTIDKFDLNNRTFKVLE